MAYIDDLAAFIRENRPDKAALSQYKIKLCSKYRQKSIPTDIQVLLSVDNPHFYRKYLQAKPTRGMSGVSVVAVMAQPSDCPHGRCITCPGGISSPFGNVPQSYTGHEPATRRAIRNRFRAYLQVFNRLEQYAAAGHMPQKVELIIMGGTFNSQRGSYKKRFIWECFQAMHDFGRLFLGSGQLDIARFREFFEMPGDLQDKGRENRLRRRVLALKKASSLEKEKKRNEKAPVRCVGLTIETRSDCLGLEQANELLGFGCTRVELGVQSVYDGALKKMQRGHTAQDNIDAIRTLKDLGFKVNAHYMPGLFVSAEKDYKGMLELFANPDYRPDMLKLYPCMVVKGTKLYDIWKKGGYKPLTTKQAARLIARFKRHVPPYCRIMRVQRDIPSWVVSAGVDRTNLRQYIHDIMKQEGWKCDCIRCREIGRKPARGRVRIVVREYEASRGTEFFISAEKQDSLLGFCRLRLPSQLLRKEITAKSALVRELHVYGEAAGIGQKGAVQHRGIGKRLLCRAEVIAGQNGKNKIVVISGIGVREYYRKQGYRRQGPYMVKGLS